MPPAKPAPHTVCAVEMHMYMSQEPFLFGNFVVKGRRLRASQTFAADFVRACAIEIHMDILQKQFWNHFTQEFTRKNVGTQSEQPGLNSYCKNLSVWTHSVGKKGTLCFGRCFFNGIWDGGIDNQHADQHRRHPRHRKSS